jgi:hypothetical protein
MLCVGTQTGEGNANLLGGGNAGAVAWSHILFL